MKRSWSLRLVLPMVLLVFSLGAIAVSVVGALIDNQRSLYQDTLDDGRRDVSALAGIAEAMAAGTGPKPGESIARMAADPRVAAAAVIDSHGRVLAATRRAWIGQAGASLPGFVPALYQQALLGHTPVVKGSPEDARVVAFMSYAAPPAATELRSRARGAVFIVYDLDAAIDQARATIVTQRLPEVLLLLFMALALSGLAHGAVARPMAAMRAAAQAVAAGEFHGRVAVRGPQEVRELGMALNEMSGKLADLVAERARRTQYLQALLDHMADGIVTTDADGHMISCNRAVAQMFGYAADELAGRHLSLLLPGGNDARLAGNLLGGHAREMEGRRRDGHFFSLDVTVTALPDQGRAQYIVHLHDINAQRQAELALRQSEENARLLVEAVQDYALVLLDTQGRVASWNMGAQRINGYGVDEVMGRSMDIFYTPEDVAAGRPSRILAAAAAAGRYEEEGWRQRKDGARFWAHVSISALRDEAGRLRGFSKVTRDVTERRQAEQAVRASEERLRTILDAEPECVKVLDSDGRLLEMNPAGLAMIEAESLDQVRSSQVAAIVVPEHRAAFIELSRQVLAGHPGKLEFEIVGLKGTRRWLETNAVTLRDGSGSSKVLGVTRDITERKHAEQALYDSTRHFEGLLAASPVGVFETDTRGSCVYVNQRWCEITGLSPAQALGDGWAAALHADDRPAVFQEWHDATRDGRAFRLEYRFCATDGVATWVLGQSVALRDADGGVTGYIGTITDITERRHADEQIRQLNAELEQRVRERTAQLEATNRELEAFSYSVSHDLRAPLRAVDGFSKVLLEDYGERLDATGRDYLRRVRAGAQNMAALIDDMLRLSRVTRAPLQPAEIDLTALARDIAADLQGGHPQHCITFEISPGMRCHGDPGLLRIALENLLGNAWKYTSKTPSAHVAFRAEHHGTETVYQLRDNGVGFDMQYAGKLFGAFQRLHRKDEFEGTGIGLATVARIVHRHGGRVWAEGRPGEGAVFSFTLGAVLPTGAGSDAEGLAVSAEERTSESVVDAGRARK